MKSDGATFVFSMSLRTFGDYIRDFVSTKEVSSAEKANMRVELYIYVANVEVSGMDMDLHDYMDGRFQGCTRYIEDMTSEQNALRKLIVEFVKFCFVMERNKN